MIDPKQAPLPNESGFDYHLSDEQLEAYRDKPLALRLAWLYQGCVLGQHYPPEIIARQERFRRAKQ